MTNAKLTAALSTLAQRAPGLLTSIETFSFAENTGILATFSVEGGDGVISVQPELIAEDEQVNVDFALGVTAYNIGNHIRERGAGRDKLLWNIAANLVAQTYVADLLGENERCAMLERRMERRFPDLEWKGLTIEQLYTAMASYEGQSSQPVRLN